jgi:Fe2+ transport system protein FeoA
MEKSMKAIATNQLFSLVPQESGYVKDLTGSNAAIGRMASMGITSGAAILMIRNPKRGPVIIEVRDTLIALGRSEAAKIQIKMEKK